MEESGTGNEITLLLRRWSAGDADALNSLIELVYPELHRIAMRHLRQERRDPTLQCTALVHEAYLRLAQKQEPQWSDRSHFYAVASRIIRGILVDYRRAQGAAKRGGADERVQLDDAAGSSGQDPVDLLDLDTALNELEQLDPQQARIVEMRFFGGLSIDETAHVLGISPATVKRDWLLAKTWIHRRLTADGPEAGRGS
ncbi:MAG: sigma-70 family RNA polymerase sigma factor [Bryobacteraceae bacterium]